MGIGYQYVAPHYIEIEFDSSSLATNRVGEIVHTPEDAKPRIRYTCDQLRGKIGRTLFDKILLSAPIGTERMFIHSL